jgi:hypothetical protein
MTKAIEQIVDAYVKLSNRRALEDLRMHRRRIAVDLKAKPEPYDFRTPQADSESVANRFSVVMAR